MNRDALSKSAEIGRVVRQDIQEILDEKDKTTVLKLEPTYRSVLNQPERVAISSASAIPATEITSVVAESSFYSFVVNLPRPALNVDNLQLLSANIPQAQVSIPDDSLVFWYYRLQTQDIRWYEWESGTTYNQGDYVSYYSGDPETFIGNYECISTTLNQIPPLNSAAWKLSAPAKYESPNLYNLFCVRLLPSFYKSETIVDSYKYGFNRTFNSYEELAAQINLACTEDDLAIINGVSPTIVQPDPITAHDYMPVVSDAPDILITFDSSINKFKLKGLQVNTPFAIPDWDIFTLYPPQSLVNYIGTTYYNITPEFGNPPDSEDPPTSWQAYFIDSDTVWNTYLAAGYNDPNVIKLQGPKTELDWNEYHRFLPGSQSIYYKGNYWTAALTNQNIPPPIGVWNADTSYSVGDVVHYETTGLSYICVLAPGPAAPLFNSSTKYYLGDKMTWEDGNDYQAATDYIPIAHSPGDGEIVPVTWDYQQYGVGDLTNAWDFITLDPYNQLFPWICIAEPIGLNPYDYPAYSSAAYYNPGDRIRVVINVFDGPYNLQVCEALYENHYQRPNENPERWLILPTMLPPVQAPQYWESIVLPDPPWINLGASKNPSNPTYWAETYNPWIPVESEILFTGVNYISKSYDFVLDEISYPFNEILGIPGQPYINTTLQTTLQTTINNETLNKRLGFSWSGQNMLIPFVSVDIFRAGSLVTLFYNRLRPIPQYAYNQRAITEGLTTVNVGLTTLPYLSDDQQATYTADAFCNMVYSSVVNIYTRILGGSTTDTVRNTNLLAIVPMACGNLGVSLFNSYIDNPLTKIDSDIYTIEVEFRTESGQPYWFSNNAVITLQLKMGYK